nr:antimicrobial peptide {immobilized peptide E18KGG} [synthetic, Peptide Synthetic, 18 aa] [synthetic construct]
LKLLKKLLKLLKKLGGGK